MRDATLPAVNLPSGNSIFYTNGCEKEQETDEEKGFKNFKQRRVIGIKIPLQKTGSSSAANKQLTGQLCVMYLPFTFTFAGFIISSCCRRKLDNAAIKDWVHISPCAGCCWGALAQTVTLRLPRLCYRTKQSLTCNFQSRPTGGRHM